jgi:branched-chain amino acid transport system substrate-binding protein
MLERRKSSRWSNRACLALLGMGVLSLAAACGSSGSSASSDASGSKQPINVGVDLPLTGPEAGPGIAMQQGYQVAANQVNAKGGINGRPVKLLFYNDQFNPTLASSNVTAMVTQGHVVAELGTYGSDECIANSATAEQYQLPNIQAECSGPTVTTRGFKYLFVTTAPTTDELQQLANYLAQDVHAPSAAVVYDNNPFATGAAQYTLQQLPKQGTKVLVNEEVALGASNYTSVAQTIAAKKPYALIMILYPNDYVTLIKNLEQNGYSPKLVFVQSGTAFETAQIQALGSAANYVLGTPQWYPGMANEPAATSFAASLKATYHVEAQPQAVAAGQAADILFAAITAAHSTTGSAIRAALAATSLNTIGGQVSFGSDGQMHVVIPIAQLQSGNGVTLWPSSIADGKFMPSPAWQGR